MPRELFQYFAVLLTASIALQLIGCRNDRNETKPPNVIPVVLPSTEPHQAGVRIDGGIVTTSIGHRCVECHEDIVTAYASSGMHDSLTLPYGEHSVEARMVGREVTDKETGITGRLDSTNGRYTVRMFYRDTAGIERSSYEMHVDLVVGSGHVTRSYFQSKDGYFFELPLTWYREIDDLAISPGRGFRRHLLRDSPQLCVSCHTGWVEPKDPQLDSGFRGEISLGIGCERCHGAAEQHCETGKLADVANPARMPEERHAEVCNQCHLTGAANILKRGVSLAEYVPGERLGKIYGIFEPKAPMKDAGTSIAGHGKRMQLSRCFTESDGMTCTTCHNPHRGHKQSETTVATRGGCFVCHNKDDCLEDPVKRQNEACAQCHMARVPSNDIVHTSITDHFIRTNPVLPDAAKLPSEERSLAAYAIRDMELVNVLDPNDELPGSRLLKARVYQGGEELALELFREQASGYRKRAFTILEEILASKPEDEEALLVKARLLRLDGRNLAALKMCDEILKHSPDSSEAIRQRAFATAALGWKEESVAWLRRVYEKLPYDQGVAGQFARALSVSNRPSEALDVLDKVRERVGPSVSRSTQAMMIASKSGLHGRGVAHAYDKLIFLPHDPSALNEAGDLCREAGLPYEQCRSLFEESLKHARNNVGALVGLAKLELREGRRNAARKILQDAPKSPQISEFQRQLK